jgi:hypothetical protein
VLQSRIRRGYRSFDVDVSAVRKRGPGSDQTHPDLARRYYKDQDDPPVIGTHEFVENAKKLGEYCGDHPDQGLITAADKVFSN